MPLQLKATLNIDGQAEAALYKLIRKAIADELDARKQQGYLQKTEAGGFAEVHEPIVSQDITKGDLIRTFGSYTSKGGSKAISELKALLKTYTESGQLALIDIKDYREIYFAVQRMEQEIL